MNIIVSGTPGSGKTTIAKFLAHKLHVPYVDVYKLLQKRKKDLPWDKKRKSILVSARKLTEILKPVLPTNAVIDSHLSHLLPKKWIQLCIITTCNQKTLVSRLKKRGWPKEKILENLDAHNFEVCYTESLERGLHPMAWDTTRAATKQKMLQEIKKLL